MLKEIVQNSITKLTTMTDLIKLLILFIGLNGFAQDKLSYIDTDQIYKDIDSLAQIEKHSNIIDLIDQVNVNDSIYWPMQINKSFYFIKLEKYKEVIEIVEAGLAHNDPELNKSFYINKAAAFDQMKDHSKALITMEQALMEYPANYEFYYNLGRYYEELKKYDKAFDAYKISATLNPFNATIHLKIGNFYLKKRMIAQALMCFDTYLLLNPDGSDSFAILKSLNNVIGQDNATKDIEGFIISENTDQFEELNMIIDNRVALQDGYETGNDINIALTKQNHVLLEYIKDFETKGDYWSNSYIKLFQWVHENDLFNALTYTVSYSIENEQYKKIVEQNRDEVIEFYQLMKNQISKIYMGTAFDFNGFDSAVYPLYANFKLDGIGQMKNGVNVGDWLFYDHNGRFTMNGQYDDSGNRAGTWTSIYPSGIIKETGIYKSGKLHGENKLYYNNGALESSSEYESDTLNGIYEQFNESGALMRRKHFLKGNLSGKYQTFYSVGEVLPELEVSYDDGLANGLLNKVSPTGINIYSVKYQNNEKTGVEKSLFENKKAKTISNYQDGLQNGKYTEYYSNGNKKVESLMVDDQFEGTYKAYYPDGTIQEEITYINGEMHGLDKLYFPNGKDYAVYEFRKGELIGFKFYDDSQNILKEGRKKGGQFYYEGISQLGQVETTGLYNVKGGKTGEWNYYSENGVLESKQNYDENLPIGELFSYHENGNIKDYSSYSEGKTEGYFKSFFKNGQMESQGYYKNGELDKEWRTYYMDGTLSSISFYHKGKRHGEQLRYSVEGNLIQKTSFKYDRLISEELFDQNGVSMGVVDWNQITPKRTIKILFSNGKTQTQFDVVNNVKHGSYLEKDALGSTISKGEYINGEPHGKWQYFYPNGNVRLELNFENGALQGQYKSFYRNGNLSHIYNYVLGNSEGKSIFYAEDGKTEIGSLDELNDENHGKRIFKDLDGNIQLIRHYSHGTILGYSYLGKDGKELPIIPLENETGKVMAYYANGNIAREMEYLNGSLINEYKTYYHNGQLEKSQTYWFDESHGMEYLYYPSGKIKEEISYSYGLHEGISKKYFENGVVKESINYRNNEKSGENIFYNEEGNEIRKDIYFNGTRIKSLKNAITAP